MRRVIALILALLGVAGAARADDAAGVYTGVLGTSPIVVRFYMDDKKLVGRYFYRSRGVDIGLVRRNAGQFIECALPGGGETVPKPCDKPTGYWALSPGGDAVTGTWRKTPQATQSLAIVLTRVAVAGSESSAEEEVYARLRAEGPTEVLSEKGASTDGAVAWQFLRDRRSGAKIPQLTKAPDPAAMGAINESLDQEFRRDIDGILSSKPGGDYSCDYAIPFANERLFVVDVGCEWYSPGAAHPSSGWGSTSYDLTTGKPIDWTEVLRYPDDKTESLDYAKGNDIVSLALRRAEHDDDCLGAAFQQLCTDNTCSTIGDSWKNVLILSPRNDGLFAAFDIYPEVARNCRGQGMTLPWDEVLPLLQSPRRLP